ncbi:MAG: Dna2/Cas4 domain-containing protein [Anaerolineae bacterium]
MGWLLLVGLLLGGLGLWLLVRSARGRREAGLPAGRVTYADMGAWQRTERSLFSPEHRLTGRPDYLVQSRRGVIPVEVKSGAAPPQPHEGHVLQLAAYCLLVEEQEGRAPPYGIIKYADRAFEIDYTAGLRARLLETLDDLRDDLTRRDVPRSHDEAARCAACSYRGRCDRRLD